MVERNPGYIERAASFSQKVDIVQIAGGMLLIGTPIGPPLVLFGGATYVLAEGVKRRARKD
jgi:hypothetical protein